MSNEVIIMAGANKSGTSSLFRYLADHPDVNGAVVKQTFYFLDRKWQDELGFTSLYSWEQGREGFLRLFDLKVPGKLLEASPEYMFAEGTPARIREILGNQPLKIVFILRDPVARLISLYYYGRQQGNLPVDLSLDDFAQQSLEYQGPYQASMMAFSTGMYSRYLQRYYDTFEPEQIGVYFFEDLVRDSRSTVTTIATDVGIEPKFYETYNFQVQHKTVRMRNRTIAKAYLGARKRFLGLFLKFPLGRKFTSALKPLIVPAYKKLNAAHDLKKEPMNEALKNEIRARFNEDKPTLEALIGKSVPW